jgi:hypothetical protein
MSEYLYYIDMWCDEVVPCDCTLEGWAAWLDQPDEDWGRSAGAEDHQTFLAREARVDQIECRRLSSAWAYDFDLERRFVAEGAVFYLRNGSEGGWWPDNSGDTVLDALAFADAAPGETAYVAAMRDGPRVELRFDRTAGGPRVVVVGEVGSA